MSEVRPPRLADPVIFLNRHGFPRTAFVTGVNESLEGEQHVPLIDSPWTVHLVVHSPLPRTYHEHFVQYAFTDSNLLHIQDGRGMPVGTWMYPEQYYTGKVSPLFDLDVDSRKVACSYCDAAPDSPCREWGKDISDHHQARVDEFIRLAAIFAK